MRLTAAGLSAPAALCAQRGVALCSCGVFQSLSLSLTHSLARAYTQIIHKPLCFAPAGFVLAPPFGTCCCLIIHLHIYAGRSTLIVRHGMGFAENLERPRSLRLELTLGSSGDKKCLPANGLSCQQIAV